VLGEPGIRFYAGAKLETSDGHNIGMLCVVDQQPRSLTAKQIHSLEILARQVAINLESHRNKERLEIALRESQKNEMSFRAIFEKSPMGIIQLNSKHQFISTNLAFQEFLGYTESQLKQMNIYDVTHPDDVDATAKKLKDIAEKSVLLTGFEKRYRRRSGEVVWARITSKYVQFEEGGEQFYFSVIEDITMALELERERLKSMQNAKLASLGELSAGVAHEINNPLAIISASMSVLESYRMEPEKFAAKVAMVRRSVDRISKIVSGLRKFSRSSENVPYEVRDLSHLIQESMVILATKAKHNLTQLDLDLRSHTLVLCNEIEIEQVVINLTNNAIDAVKPLSNKWVQIKLFDQDSSVVLQVRDSGPGIAPEIEAKLFQPFFTTKPVGAGTGLGLSITKGILDQHKATISVNRNDSHTCFEVRFPKHENKKVALRGCKIPNAVSGRLRILAKSAVCTARAASAQKFPFCICERV
jgi:PAS domain S-box-containing protein